MGIGIVLMFWLVLGLIAAGIAGAVLAALAGLFTRRVPKGRRRVIIAALLLPFFCVGWFLAAFIGQGLINEAIFHRDPGLGDGWHTPLPNGYVVEFIDVLDHGTLYDPTIAVRDGGAADGQEGTINGVRTAQLEGSLILGCVEEPEFSDIGKILQRYCFILDTRTHHRTDYADEGALRLAAKRMGIVLHLEPLYDLYATYRTGWFDCVTVGLTLLVPAIAFLVLVWWIIRIRQRCLPAAV